MITKFLNSKFKKDLIFSYFTQSLTIFFGFFQIFIINRYFGIESYGQLTIIISTAGIFSALLTARSSEAITKFFTREILHNNLHNAKFILFLGFTIDIVTAFLLVLAMYVLSDFIAHTFIKNIQLSNEVFLYSLVVFFGFLRGTFFGYFQSKEMFFWINSITTFESFVKIILLVVIVFILDKNSLEAIIYTLILSSLLSYVYTFLLFTKYYRQEFKEIHFEKNKLIAKEYWDFNIKTFFSSSLKAGNQNIDNLIIAYFLNSQIVGIYQVLKKMLSPIQIIASPFASLAYPKMVHFFETNQKAKFYDLIIRISFYIFIAALFYTFILYFVKNKLLDYMHIVFLPDYNLYFSMLALLTILNSQMWWIRAFSNTVNPNYSIYINVFATFFQLSVTLIMSKLYGLNGMLVSMNAMNLLILGYWFTKGYKYIHAYIINVLKKLIKRITSCNIGA